MKNKWEHTHWLCDGTFLKSLEDLSKLNIDHIATHLSKICRFSGGTPIFYSVAEHCLLVSLKLREEGESPLVQLIGLLHDANEALLGDQISFIKPILGEKFKKLEKDIEMRLFKRFIDPNISAFFLEAALKKVKKIDKQLAVLEIKELFLGEKLGCLLKLETNAKGSFLRHYNFLFHEELGG